VHRGLEEESSRRLLATERGVSSPPEVGPATGAVPERAVRTRLQRDALRLTDR
jgi:hypothetical protein